MQWQDQDVIFPVIEARLKYQGPARYDDMLAIDISITLAKMIRLNFAYVATIGDNKRVLEGETFHVCSGIDERPKALPEELLKLLQPWMNDGAFTAGIKGNSGTRNTRNA